MILQEKSNGTYILKKMIYKCEKRVKTLKKYKQTATVKARISEINNVQLYILQQLICNENS